MYMKNTGVTEACGVGCKEAAADEPLTHFPPCLSATGVAKAFVHVVLDTKGVEPIIVTLTSTPLHSNFPASSHTLSLSATGVTEAFVHAVLDAKGLQQMNVLLIAFSVAHVTASIVCIKALGAVGLVIADALNMALRIACSAWWVQRKCEGCGGEV